MALSAYLSKKTCSVCGSPIVQSEKQGRVRLQCNNACKQQAYRNRITACLECGRLGIRPFQPKINRSSRCWVCEAVMEYTPQHQWVTTKHATKAKLKLVQAARRSKA